MIERGYGLEGKCSCGIVGWTFEFPDETVRLEDVKRYGYVRLLTNVISDLGVVKVYKVDSVQI